MNLKLIFSVCIIVFLCLGHINAQIKPTIKKVALSEQDRSLINKQISEYTTFTLDNKKMLENLTKDGRCNFQIYIDEKLNWTFDLKLNDMRAPNYKQTYISKEGEFDCKLQPSGISIFLHLIL